MTISFLTKKKEGVSPIHIGNTPYNHVLKANNNLKNKSNINHELFLFNAWRNTSRLKFTMQRYGISHAEENEKP